MEEKVLKIFFVLLRHVVCGEALPNDVQKPFAEEDIHRLLDLAKEHSILPLLAEALLQNHLVPQGSAQEICQGILFQAIFLYQQLEGALQKLSALFEDNAIAYLPLKGAFLRQYYKEPWLRTSCDIDILVHEADLKKASTLLADAGYTFESRTPHDVSYRSPEGAQVELHHRLIEKERAANVDVVLENIWQFAVLQKGQFGYALRDEMFYFYHIAHMAKHVAHGGCGIRPFIDLWLLHHRVSFEQEKRQVLLEQGGLTKFEKVAKGLSEAWLSGNELTPIGLQLEAYILSGGVYGTTENRVAIQQQRQGGNQRFIWKRLFLPYNLLQERYPILQKHKWLMPVMHIRRLGRLLSKKKRDNAIAELKISQAVPGDSKQSMQSLWEQLGL